MEFSSQHSIGEVCKSPRWVEFHKRSLVGTGNDSSHLLDGVWRWMLLGGHRPGPESERHKSPSHPDQMSWCGGWRWRAEAGVSISSQVFAILVDKMDNHPHPRKRFMTQLCTLYCLLSHKTSANPIKNLAESLPHLFRPEAGCRDNSLGTGSLKPALGRKRFAGLLIFIHSHLPAQPPWALRHRASNDSVQCAGLFAEL